MIEDFGECNSWFDDAFRDKCGARFPTFKIALNLLLQNGGKNIVETGTIRQFEDYGAGYSTYIFGSFIKMYGGNITTIDIDGDNMEVCRAVTREFEELINYVVEDSLTALTKITEPIDLLYLDSLDTPLEGDATKAQEHNLKEFKIVEHLLHDKSVVLLDDNFFENGGKTRLTKKYLHEKGWKLLFNSQQSLWVKN